MELKDVAKLAQLSRIDMTDAELEELLRNMESILGYVRQIESVMTDGTAELSAVRNIMREDTNAHPSGQYTDILIKEAPKSEAGFVKVTQIFSEADAPTL